MTNVRDRVLVIVPAWNEALNVGSTIHGIQAAAENFDVLVVNDGSTDETEAAASQAGAVVLTLPFNLGVGGAMRTGFIWAHRNGYRQAIQVDADGQHNPADIARVVAGLEHADIAIGARFADVGTYSVRGPRRWAMVVLSKTLSRLSGTRLTDVTSGFRAANERAISQYIRYYPAEYLGDTVDSLVAALHAGLTVTQVPVAFRPRQSGRPSNGPIGATLYLIRAALALGLALVGRRTLPRSSAESVPQ